MREYKHKDITGKILNCAFEVHNYLGCGFLEKVYEHALIYELNSKGLKVENQKPISIDYKGKSVGIYTADLIVEDLVVVEVKAAEFLSRIHYAQTLNYLRAAGYEVGLILNFAKPKLEYKRVLIYL